MFDSTPLELRSSLPELTQALAAGKILKVENGRWISLGIFSRFVNWIKGETSSNLLQVITSINKLFDEIETGRSALNKKHCKRAARVLYARCSKTKSAELKLASADLKGRLLSLYYQKRVPDRFNPHTYQSLLNAAAHWQSKDPLYAHCPLTEQDKERLKEAAKYPEFVAHLQSNEMERHRFFRWTIRHKNYCEPYILFRSTAEKLTDCSLSTRIGFFGGQDLKVQTDGSTKILTLKINGIDRNILDGTVHYTLARDYDLSVDEMFAVFRDRQKVIGNLEFFRGVGILNYNPKRLGIFNPATNQYEMINLDTERWWEQLIPVETLTLEEASQRFEDGDGNKIPCDGIYWIASIYATTDSLVVDATGNHAYLQIAIPTHDRRYNIYNFGKFTEEYPITSEEKKRVAVEPMDAVIMYPDENIFNLDRFTEGVSWVLSPEEGLSRMASLRKDIQRVRNKNIVFQLFNGNCIMWCFQKMHRYATEAEKRHLAGVRFVDATPSGSLGYVWTFFRLIPEKWVEPTLNWLIGNLGGDKVFTVTKKNGSSVQKGLLKNVPWHPEARFPHPGALVIRKREKKGIFKKIII